MPSIEKHNDMLQCAILLDSDLRFPRNITSHNGDIWLIDKGDNLFENGQRNGALYLYKKQAKGYEKRRILDNLDDPNDVDIRLHKDDKAWLYFTTRKTVQRFKISSHDIRPQVVINDIPTYGWHKLTAINVSQDSLFLTVPSSTDHCETLGITDLVSYPCVEEEDGTGQIRQYDFEDDKLLEKYTVVATGLRDALATQLTAGKKS